jgi:hypothetical protein
VGQDRRLRSRALVGLYGRVLKWPIERDVV